MDTAPAHTQIAERQDTIIEEPGTTRFRRYKVLMIAPTSFFADYGCHVRILEEAQILRKLGHQVVICTYHNGRDVGGLPIERTVHIPWRGTSEVGSSRHKLAFDALLAWKTLRVAWRFKPDVIHAHLHEGALIGWPVSLTHRIPLVFDFQGSLTSEMVDHNFLQRDGRLYRPVRRLEDFIDRLPAAIVTSSYHAADLCIREFQCPADQVHTVPDCVNADTFRPGLLNDGEREASLRELGVPPGRKVVVYLGLLAEYQGTSLLLQAAARLVAQQPDVHFLIMGYPGEDFYRAKAAELGVTEHTTFTGKIPYEQAPRYLALGDVAAAPKISSTEGSGKVLNYMAMGLPTAAFATPVSREYLRGDGIYADVGDPESLAEALGTLVSDDTRAAAIGHRLRQGAIEEYAWERAAERILSVYQEVERL